MTTNQIRKEIFETNIEFYVNIDHKFFNNLTRTQVAFVCLIERLNKANLIATNKEIASYLGITKDGSYVSKMIDNINKKFPKLLKTNFDTRVNHFNKVMTTDEECYSRGRNITLSRPLHIKGETYINIPSFAVSKRSCFLNSNELAVLAYLKSMPEKRFSGLLRVLAKKLGLSLEIIKRALKKLVSIKAIFKRYESIKHKLKNIWYRINYLSINHKWVYVSNELDEAEEIIKSHKLDHKKEESWDEIYEALGGTL